MPRRDRLEIAAVKELPDPLVQRNVDLKGFKGFMLDVDRLLASELVALASPEQLSAAFMLWCRAWKQSPPASLPDDDAILASFSGAGRKWSKVKDMALRGFVKCSDGRLYHRVLAEEANEAWRRREKYRSRAKTAADSRWNKQCLENATSIPKALHGECLGNAVDGTGTVEEERTVLRTAADAAPDEVIWSAGVKLLTGAGVSESSARAFLGDLRKRHDDSDLAAAVWRCMAEKPIDPRAWLKAAMGERKRRVVV